MTPPLIEEYRKLLNISRQILQSAQEKDWERTVTLEANRTAVLKRIQSLPDVSTLAIEERLEIAKLIEDILHCDEQSTPLIAAEMVELRELMNSVANERRLGQSYL